MSSISVRSCSFLSCCWAPLGRVWLQLLLSPIRYLYTWIRPPWASPRLNSPSSPSLSPWGTLSLGNWMMLRYHNITGKPSLWLTGVFWELLVWGTMSKLPDFCIAVPLLWDWEFLPCQRHVLVSSLLLVSQCTGVTLISKWPRLGAHILPVRGRWMFPFSQT